MMQTRSPTPIQFIETRQQKHSRSLSRRVRTSKTSDQNEVIWLGVHVTFIKIDTEVIVPDSKPRLELQLFYEVKINPLIQTDRGWKQIGGQVDKFGHKYQVQIETNPIYYLITQVKNWLYLQFGYEDVHDTLLTITEELIVEVREHFPI